MAGTLKQVTDNNFENSEVLATFRFDTRDPLAAAPVIIRAGERYRIRVQEEAIVGGTADAPWKDNKHPADANGLLDEPSLAQRVSLFPRRDTDEKWFKVIASIGPDEDELLPIGKEKIFVATTSGRLYLFVNDLYGFYGNNHGTAKIIVERLDGVAPNTGAK